MIRIGVIGYGYWGPNLVRNFSEIEDFKVTMVADVNADSLAKAQKRYPALQITTQVDELLQSPQVDVVAVATPVFTHYELGLKALRSGKHLFMEKPFTSNSEQGLRLLEEAQKLKLKIFVDHTFIHTGAVRKIQEVVASGKLGKIYYYDSVRINLGLFQHDVNVLWDLAVHDLAIMDYVLNQKPVAVAATGISHVPGGPENIAYLTCFFNGNTIAHIHVNWLSPVKIRTTLIGGDRQMIVYDDMEPTEKVKVYDKGITLNNSPEERYKLLVGYRTGDVWTPQLDTTEALRWEASGLADYLLKGKEPASDGRAGLRIVHILEAGSRSLAKKGQPVELEWGKLKL